MPLKFVLNQAGVGELLKSAEMQAVLNGYAKQCAGANDTVKVKQMGTRAVAFIDTDSKDNRLLKSIKSRRKGK